jgi:hypothetical protein
MLCGSLWSITRLSTPSTSSKRLRSHLLTDSCHPPTRLREHSLEGNQGGRGSASWPASSTSESRLPPSASTTCVFERISNMPATATALASLCRPLALPCASPYMSHLVPQATTSMPCNCKVASPQPDIVAVLHLHSLALAAPNPRTHFPWQYHTRTHHPKHCRAYRACSDVPTPTLTSGWN